MRVCVKTFSIRYEVYWYDKKQPDFLIMRENQRKNGQKSNIFIYYGLATLIWNTP
jgi:hypothetical protein